MIPLCAPQVDATQFEGGCAEPACCSVPLLADQISIADAVVGSKANLCSEEALQRFHRWAQGLFPPKRLVATARQGQLEAAAAEALVGRAAAHGQGNGSSSQAAQPAADSGALGLPVQRPGRAAGAPWLSSSAAEADEEAPRERPLRKEVTNAEATHAACG